MASTLYDSILKKGEVVGEVLGEAAGSARSKTETIIGILIHRVGWVDPAVRDRIRGLSDSETLASWYEDALRIIDAEDARRLVDKIQNMPA